MGDVSVLRVNEGLLVLLAPAGKLAIIDATF
jgi:hypothetical protein